MDKERLQGTLVELHDALTGAENVDDKTRELLRTVTTDIHQLLDRSGVPTEQDVHPISSNLRELLLQFESEHPQLTSIVGRIADGLANLGI